MSSIITHIIRPGLGPVCPECFSRGHVGAFPLTPGEVYSYGITDPPGPTGLGTSTRPRALIADRPPRGAAAGDELAGELAYRADQRHAGAPRPYPSGQARRARHPD